MEDTNFCPIEEALFRIEVSAKTNKNFINTLLILQRIISNVLSSSNQGKKDKLDQENKQFLHDISRCEEVRQFLELVGLREDDQYEHEICDEEMKCLEAALRIVNTHIHNASSVYFEEKPISEVNMIRTLFSSIRF